MLKALLPLLAAVVFLVQSPEASAQCDRGDASDDKAQVSSNAYYDVVSVGEVQFKPDVAFEIVVTKEGRTVLRYGSDLDGFLEPAGGLECGCGGGCSGDCSVQNNGGSATCRGGCYEGSGTACTSCIFREQQAD